MATQANVMKSVFLYLVIPPFIPVFFSAILSFKAPWSLVVYSLLATVNSAYASQPIASHAAILLLTALPFQQPFLVSPGYLPVPLMVVSQITVSKFMNLEDLLAENITITEQEL